MAAALTSTAPARELACGPAATATVTASGGPHLLPAPRQQAPRRGVCRVDHGFF